MNNSRHDFANRLLGRTQDPAYRRAPFPFKPETAKISRPAPPRGRPPAGTEVVRSTCFSCNTACEVLIFVDKSSGRVLKVEGDPESPVTRGVLCAKGLTAKDLVESPERLRSPLKQIGRCGKGKRGKISWGEALSLITDKLITTKKNYGPQSLAFLQGTQRGWTRSFSRRENGWLPSCAQHCEGRAYTVTAADELTAATAAKKYSWSAGQVVYISDKWVDLGKRVPANSG